MSTGAFSLDRLGHGLDRASPVLLKMLERAIDDLSNHPLLKDEQPSISNGAAEETDAQTTPDPPAQDDKKPAKGARGTATSAQPRTVGKGSPAPASAPLPADDACSAVPTPTEPVVQDTYDQQIALVHAKAEEDLLASLELEQYLLHQHEAVERATAAAMAAKDQQYTRFWRYSGVPHVPAKLELDSARMQAAGLPDLTVTLQTLRDNQRVTVLNPPVIKEFSDNTSLPHYLANTAANTNRERMRKNVIARCRKSIREGKAFTWHSLPLDELAAAMKASRRRQKLSSLRMNGDQWDAERRVIQRIQDKLNFTRNPRYQDTIPTTVSTATMDPLLNRPQFGVGTVSKASPSKPNTSFVCEPETVRFTDWQPGQVYQAIVQIRNVSATLQRVRVLPAISPFFHVSRLIFPAIEGVIAPGVHAEVRIRFTPDSLADFSDKMTVVTEHGEIAVPLTATRIPPVLDLDSQVSLGNVYVGSTIEQRIAVRAEQGKGTFKLVPSGAWARQEFDIEAIDYVDLPGGFRVSPAHFTLAAGGSVNLDFTFAPAVQGPAEAAYMLICDNFHVRELNVTGRGVEPDATVVAVDGVPCNPSPRIIRFPCTIPGSSAKRTMVVRNDCCAPLPFRWVVSGHAQAADVCQRASNSISVLPEQGIMQPHEEVLFDVLFAPTACCSAVSLATLEMGPGASAAAGDPPAALRRLQLQCEGIAPYHPASVYPRTLRAPEHLEVGSTFGQSFVIKNPAAVPACFTITGASEGRVAVSQQQGTVGAQSQTVIHVVASSSGELDLQHTLQCCIEHGLVHEVSICASFSLQLPVQLHTAEIDFGLVCCGAVGTALVQLKNPSSCSAATWSVSCTQPAVQTAATVDVPVSSGVLQPEQWYAVEVQCTGATAGLFRGHARVCSHGADMLVPLQATVATPGITLGAATESCELGTTYVGVPVTRCLELVNETHVPAQWRLRPSLMGTGSDILHMLGQPDSGTLSAMTRQAVLLTIIPQQSGSCDGLLVVDVDHAEHPAVVPISCCAEGLQVEYSIARGLRQEHVNAASSNRVEEPVEGGVIDFGQRIAVGDTVTLQLVLTNSTAIEAAVQLSLEHFKAAEEQNVESCSAGKSLEGRPSRGLLLGDAHERTAPFRAQAGQDLLATRAAQEAARALLVDRGIAIKLSVAEAVLPPFGRCTVDMQLVSNCVGTYLDRLQCCVGNLKPEMFWIRAGIIGSPVHVQREAVLIRGLHENISTATRLDFGSVPQNVEVTRSFSAFNQSGFEVDIEFAVHVWEKRPGTRWVDVGLQVQADGHVELAARPKHTTAEECASFGIHPKSVHLGPGESGKVTACFSSAAAMHHEAIILGKQKLRYHAESVNVNIMSQSETAPAEVVLRGSFHPFAGPPPTPLSPLKVHLSSFCIQPRLELEHGPPLQWAVHSTHGPTAGSRQQTVILCNRTGSPLSFNMNTTGPFEVSHVVTSVPQEPHRFVGSTCFSQYAWDAAGCGAYCLPPQESVDVAIQCVLAAPKHGAEDCRATGVLHVCFSNGHVQKEALEARMLHPRLQCRGRGGKMLHHADFGRVAVGSCRVVQVLLENPSEVDAVWTATLCGVDAGAAKGPGEAARPEMQRRKPDERACTVHSEPGCDFTATPSKGLLHGSTPERRSAQAVLSVSFSPSTVGEVVAALCFGTRGGTCFSVTLRGTATVDECHEPDWRLTDLYQ